MGFLVWVAPHPPTRRFADRPEFYFSLPGASFGAAGK